MKKGLLHLVTVLSLIAPCGVMAETRSAAASNSTANRFHGLDPADARSRFFRALFRASLGKAEKDPFAVSIFRAMEIDLDLLSMQARIDQMKPGELMQSGLPYKGDHGFDRMPVRFRDGLVQIKRAKPSELDSKLAMAVAVFAATCADNETERNARLASGFAGARWTGANSRIVLRSLTIMRNNRCLNEADYQRLAGPAALKMAKSLGQLEGFDLANALYDLFHGGFSSLVGEEDLLRFASLQSSDGNWRSKTDIGTHGVAAAAGAYVLASVLRAGGEPILKREIEDMYSGVRKQQLNEARR